ncbi:unnamed protein product [Heligmosomoides polygyrus]|uniref:Uncharacterized protein n=1 Tax=Heligmosomoides polygyrus TaxID=6339 RepID=A0A183FDB7_HELPZ|nr:unnamed protein product [Heligmosomoides polygyrus]
MKEPEFKLRQKLQVDQLHSVAKALRSTTSKVGERPDESKVDKRPTRRRERKSASERARNTFPHRQATKSTTSTPLKKQKGTDTGGWPDCACQAVVG